MQSLVNSRIRSNFKAMKQQFGLRRNIEADQGAVSHLRPLFSMLTIASIVISGIANTGLAKSSVELKPIAQGFTSPTALVQLPGKSGKRLIADQVGTVHVLTSEGELKDELFLDLRDRMVELNEGFDERGLLGLALHPNFKANRRLFVYYSAPLRDSAPDGWNHTSHVSEFKVYKDDRDQVNPASERILLRVDQPQFNHDGGTITFGPDGYLYIPLGDGGKANDTGKGHPAKGNGQDITTLLGSILRIDVDGDKPYGIPSDNPFVGRTGKDEIYAYGLRNPWGIAFDPAGGHRLFAADVGQNSFEEVNIIEKGGNYGWHIREGFHCFDPDQPNKAPADCPDVGANGEPLIDPILEYKNRKTHSDDPEAFGISVVGGHVYRGEAISALQGKYVFADWSRNWGSPQGVLLAASQSDADSGKPWRVERLGLKGHPNGELDSYIVSFAQDRAGEIYVMTNDRNGLYGKNGKVYKLVPSQ